MILPWLFVVWVGRFESVGEVMLMVDGECVDVSFFPVSSCFSIGLYLLSNGSRCGNSLASQL